MNNLNMIDMPSYDVLNEEDQKNLENELITVLSKYKLTLSKAKYTFFNIIRKIEEENIITL